MYPLVDEENKEIYPEMDEVIEIDIRKEKKLTFLEKKAKLVLKVFKQDKSILFNAKTRHCSHALGCFTDMFK
jgi:hypothetical protein